MLEEATNIPSPPPDLGTLPPQDHIEQSRQWKQEKQGFQKTIELLQTEVHRKEQRLWEEEANSEFGALSGKVELVGKENLLAKMLCRNALKLNDPLAAVLLMGDVEDVLHGAGVTYPRKEGKEVETCHSSCNVF